MIVDNAIYAFGYHLDNGIPIKSWFDDQSDVELRDILPILDKVLQAEDVRDVLRETFKLNFQISQAISNSINLSL